MGGVVARVRGWPRERILKIRARVHRTLDVQQEQVNSDIEADKVSRVDGSRATARGPSLAELDPAEVKFAEREREKKRR